MISKVIRLKTRIEKLGYLSYFFFLPISKYSNNDFKNYTIVTKLSLKVLFFMKEANYNHFKIDPKLHHVCDGEVHL